LRHVIASASDQLNGGYAVAELCGPDTEANARLIAAAPELYEALAQLLHECVEAGFDAARDYNWPKSLADASAALAKARGETNAG